MWNFDRGKREGLSLSAPPLSPVLSSSPPAISLSFTPSIRSQVVSFARQWEAPLWLMEDHGSWERGENKKKKKRGRGKPARKMHAKAERKRMGCVGFHFTYSFTLAMVS